MPSTTLTSCSRMIWRQRFVEGALPHGMVHIADDDAAIALWISDLLCEKCFLLVKAVCSSRG